MKHLIALLALASMNVVAVSAQDVMKITFKDASTANYPVETITDITFEDSDPGVTPPAPTDKVLVTRINDSYFTYDDAGRCTSITTVDTEYDETFTLSFNYSTMKFSMYGLEVGTFKINNAGYLTNLNINTMGASSSAVFNYDTEGHVIAIESKYNSYNESGESEFIYNWENGLLLNSIETGWAIEDGEKSTYNYTLNFTYSDIENTLGQWTMGMFDDDGDGDLDLAVTGMYGKAPVRFPNSLKWSTDSPKLLSYTFNPDGTIATEKINSKVLNYYYDAQSPKSVAPKILRKIAGQIKRSIK